MDWNDTPRTVIIDELHAIKDLDSISYKTLAGEIGMCKGTFYDFMCCFTIPKDETIQKIKNYLNKREVGEDQDNVFFYVVVDFSETEILKFKNLDEVKEWIKDSLVGDIEDDIKKGDVRLFEVNQELSIDLQNIVEIDFTPK